MSRLGVWSLATVATSLAALLVAPLPAGGECLAPPVAGHRGSTLNGATENGLPAFAAATALGAGWLDLDVRVTSDGYLVVMHDATVDRTTDGSGAVAGMSLAQVRALRLLDGSRVPTVSEVLQWATGTDAQLSVELKSMGGDSTYRRLLRQISVHGMRDRVLVKSFKQRLVDRVRVFAGWVQTGLSTYDRLSASRVAWSGGYVAIEHHAVTTAWVARQHAMGNVVHTWTPNDAAAYAPVVDAGVDVVITDRMDTYAEYTASRCNA